MKNLVLGLLAMLALASYGDIRCPLDDSKMYWTGKTEFAENGRMLREYRCAYGHLLWIVNR